MWCLSWVQEQISRGVFDNDNGQGLMRVKIKGLYCIVKVYGSFVQNYFV